eukprot:189264-Chlamydomonas_euryale.AAC.1
MSHREVRARLNTSPPTYAPTYTHLDDRADKLAHGDVALRERAPARRDVLDQVMRHRQHQHQQALLHLLHADGQLLGGDDRALQEAHGRGAHLQVCVVDHAAQHRHDLVPRVVLERNPLRFGRARGARHAQPPQLQPLLCARRGIRSGGGRGKEEWKKCEGRRQGRG